MTPLERIRDLDHKIEQHRQGMAQLGRERAQVIRDWVAAEGVPAVAELLKVTRQSIYRAMHHD
jgi:NADH:ubiquinone oxidoreductase subunit E